MQSLPKSSPSAIIKFTILLILIVLFIFLGQWIHLNVEPYVNVLREMPLVLSGIVFVLLYTVVTFFIWIGSKDAFRITAAYVYGPWISTIFVWIAELCNLVVLFSLSRKLGRDFVENKLKGKQRRWDESLAKTGVGWIFLFKFFPIIPFRFLDLGFGLTKISLK
ncbi:MAG: VTT domain-containing protein, partial [Candidatus Omnitrophica bacterium]|nr:VTT domain-containing protein [Candidatus Omnitrophota bacterium]